MIEFGPTGTARTTPRAFPSSAIDDAYGGMTLRDWFAGQVLNHSLEAARLMDGTIVAAEAAEWAYQVADAMMVERERSAPA